MRILVFVLLLLGAHFSLTAFVPGAAGNAVFYWPWAADARPLLAGVGGLPQQGGSVLTPALAGIAGLCFLGAAAALLGIVIPADWWRLLVMGGTVASIALFVLFLSPLSVLPIAVDLLLLWGLFAQQWTVAGLQGA
jgi:hypothetical protein